MAVSERGTHKNLGVVSLTSEDLFHRGQITRTACVIKSSEFCTIAKFILNLQNVFWNNFSDQVYPPPSAKPGHPTFIIVQLVPIAVDDVHVKEAEQSAGDQEAVGKGKVLDVARVQGEGVGGRGHGAQAHQLADHIPDANTWKNNKNGTQQQKKKKAHRPFFHRPRPQNTDVSKSKHLRLIQLMENGVIIEIRAVKQ